MIERDIPNRRPAGVVWCGDILYLRGCRLVVANKHAIIPHPAAATSYLRRGDEINRCRFESEAQFTLLVQDELPRSK